MRPTAGVLAAMLVALSVIMLLVLACVSETANADDAPDVEAYPPIADATAPHADSYQIATEDSPMVAYGEASGDDAMAAHFDSQACTVEMTRHIGLMPLTTLAVLMLMWFYTLAISAGRAIIYTSAHSQSRKFDTRLSKILRRERFDEAIHFCLVRPKSHRAFVVRTGLRELSSFGVKTHISASRVEIIKLAMRRASEVKRVELSCRLSGIKSIAATAALVGLFSTVVSLLDVLAWSHATESAGIGAVAGGIAESLLMTAIGLFVALHAVWCHNHLSRRVEKLAREMDESASNLVEHLLKSVRREADV